MRTLSRLAAVLLVISMAVLFAQRPAGADPGIGSDAAFPIVGVSSDTVLEPAAGAPVGGPLAPPPATRITSLLAPVIPPGVGETEDISYGDEKPLTGPFFLEFSVGPKPGGALPTGHPLAPSAPPPAISLRQEAAVFPPGPFGDGSTMSDIFQSIGPLGAPVCGLFPNSQILDEDGSPAGRIGLNLPAGSNLDAYDRTEEVPIARPAPVTGGPPVPGTGIIFFTIDAATAAAWPAAGLIPAPPGGAAMAIPGPSDILAWNPAVGGPVIYATAAMLGLVPGDDVDALAVQYTSGVPLPPLGPGFIGAPPFTDLIVFSLAPGSTSLSPTSGGTGVIPLTPNCGLLPGTGTAGDTWYVGMPVAVGGAIPYFNAEALGLAAARSAPSPDDNLDALDMCNGYVGTDMDGDTIDDGCDFDIDGDLIGNVIDNCPTVVNPTQANSDSGPMPPAGNTGSIDNGPGIASTDGTVPNGDGLGDACDPDLDNDGLPNIFDTEPLLAAAGPCLFPGASDGHPNPAGVTPIDNSNDDNGSDVPAPPMGADPLDNGPSWDTDNDGVLDGVECTLGFNPRSSLSKPPMAACGGAADIDLNGLPASAETCKWGTIDGVVDSDGDGKKDCVEANDTNGDGAQNFPGDTINSAKAANGVIGKTLDFDLNGDGFVTFPGDTILSAKMANHVGGIC